MVREKPEQVAVSYNNSILDFAGPDFAAENSIEYNPLGERYYIKEKGEKRKATRAEVDAFVADIVPPPPPKIADLLKSNDMLSLINLGDSMRNRGYFLMGKGYYLYLLSDKAGPEAFEAMGAQYREMTGKELPTKSTLTKAAKVWERFVVKFQDEDGNPTPDAPDLEELAQASLRKLYTISAHTDEGRDVKQMVEDAKTKPINDLVEKYVEPSSKSNAGAFYPLPAVRKDMIDKFNETRHLWGALVGQNEISNKQMVDASIEVMFTLINSQPNILIDLYKTMFESDETELPDAPKGRGGKLSVNKLASMPKSQVRAMYAAEKITSEDLLRLTDEEIKKIGLSSEAGFPEAAEADAALETDDIDDMDTDEESEDTQ